MVYTFTNLSRQEIEAMSGLNLQETRVYQEASAEGGRQQRGHQEEARSLIFRPLHRCLGLFLEPVRSRLSALSVVQLNALGAARLDSAGLSALHAWIDLHAVS